VPKDAMGESDRPEIGTTARDLASGAAASDQRHGEDKSNGTTRARVGAL
jgi:hypothetical protein